MLPQLESWGMSAADEATRLDLPFHDKDGGRDMTVVCGIDVGSLRTLSYVAWLSGRLFVLDLHVSFPANPTDAMRYAMYRLLMKATIAVDLLALVPNLYGRQIERVAAP